MNEETIQGGTAFRITQALTVMRCSAYPQFWIRGGGGSALFCISLDGFTLECSQQSKLDMLDFPTIESSLNFIK